LESHVKDERKREIKTKLNLDEKESWVGGGLASLVGISSLIMGRGNKIQAS
jgi:hypothetical protein